MGDTPSGGSFSRPAPHQPTILFVDDELSLLRSTALVLRREPYRVLTATSAREALDTIEQVPVDVIISDERMPGMSGAELLAAVRRKYPRVVRLMLTGEAGLERTARAVHEGAPYRLLFKPIEPSELKATLRQAIATRFPRTSVFPSGERQRET